MTITRNKFKKIMSQTKQEEEDKVQEKIETVDSHPMYDTLVSWYKIIARKRFSRIICHG